MSLRYLLSPGRFVLSRPGYDASDPNLPNVYKILDSNWQFSGSLISSGAFAVSNLYGQFPLTIMFPAALHFIPAALAYLLVGDGGTGSTEVLHLQGNIGNDRIVLTGGNETPWFDSSSGVLHYKIFGL
jgi:hypothetical protein